MADNINTKLDVDVDLQAGLREVTQLAEQFEKVISKTLGLSRTVSNINLPISELNVNAKQLGELLARAQTAALGTSKALAAATSQRASRANFNATDEGFAAKVINEQVAQQRALSRAASETKEQFQLQLKLQQGIVDTQTLAYKQQLASAEIVRLQGLAARQNGAAREAVLAKLNEEIKALEQIESQQRAITEAASIQAQREKDIAAAERQRAQQNRELTAIEAANFKRAKEEELGESQVAALNRKRIAEQDSKARIAAAKDYWDKEAKFSAIYEKAQRENIEFDAKARAEAARAEARSSTPQALNAAGREAYDNAEALRKIKAGIVDIDTLAYQRTQAQIEVGRLLRAEVGAEASVRANITKQLETQYALLRTIDQKESEVNTSTRLNRVFEGGGANLLKIQAQLIVNYGLINAALNSIRFSTQFVTDLDEAFHELQAIAGLTNQQINELQVTILDVAKNSKFSAKEIAESAVVLAQAGLSGDQIKGSLKAINDLATASGSTLANAVQNVTSVLNIFNYGADQTAQVANQMTGALNLSKLSMDQITLGIQYAANTAAEAKVPFAEMIATFGALANAGIKAGSTIGTGYRKLIQDLLNPTEAFQKRVAQLGLSMEDLDIKTKGITAVLTTLQNAGFTASDAIRTLDVRASAVAVPLLRSADAISLFQQKLYLTETTVSGAEKQMESLNNSLNKLKNSFGALVFDTFSGFTSVLAKITSLVADMLNHLGPFKSIIEGVVVALTVVSAGALTGQLLKLLSSLTGIGAAIGATVSGFKLLAGAFTGLELSAAGASLAMGNLFNLLKVSGGPIFFAVTAGASALYYAYSKIAGLFESNAEKIDKVKTELASLEAETDKYTQRSTQLNNFLKTLVEQYQELSTNSELLRARTLEAAAAFNKMGSETILAGDRIEVLIDKVKRLSAENYRGAVAAQEAQLAKLGLSSDLTRSDLNDKRQSNASLVQSISDVVNRQVVNQTGRELGADSPITKALNDAVKIFNNPNRNRNDIDTLTTAVAQAQVEAAKSNDPIITRTLDKLASVVEEQKRGLDELYKNDLTKTELETKLGGAKVDASTIASVIELLGRENPIAQAAVKGFRDDPGQSSGKIAITNLSGVISAFDKRIEELKSASGPAANNSDSITILEGKRAEVEALRLQISEQQFNREKLRAADSTEQADLIIRQNELVVQTGTMKQAELATQEIINAAQVKYKNAIDEATAFTKSDKFIKERFTDLGLSGKGDNLKAEQERYLQLKTAAAKLELDNAQKNAQKNLANRGFNVDPAIQRDITSPIQLLKNAITETTTAYKRQIDAIDASTKSAQAQRAALDDPKNAAFIGDGARFRKDEENRAQAEAALRDKSAQTAAYIQDLLQKQAQAEILAGKSLAQAQAEAGTGEEFGGIAQGKQATKGFKIDKTEANQATKTLLDIGKSLREAEKSQADFNAELEKYAVVATTNENIGKTLADSFHQFSVLSYYGSRSMSQDFMKVFGDIKDGFGNVVTNLINGNKSIAQSFKEVASSIIGSLQQIAIKRFSQGIFDSLFGAAGSAGGGLLGSLFGAASKGVQVYSSPVGPFPGVTQFASGGIVTGGTPGKDSVPIMAMPGEGILNTKAMSILGSETLNKLNNGNVNTLQAQSQVQSVEGGKKNVNVYIVTPDQVPSVGPNDVVAIVSDNIARGGSLKNLIKQVQI